MDVFWSAPPVSRTLTALTFIQSALVYGGMLDGYLILFLPKRIFQLPPEIWRLFSPFLLTGPNLSFFFDLYFMFTYGSTLESGSPRFSIPGDFFTYVLFVGVVILVSDGITYPQSLQSESYKSSLMASVVKRDLFLYFPSHLAYLPAQHYLAEAVPGSEEDQPYTSYRSLSAVNPLDCMRCRMVGSPLR